MCLSCRIYGYSLRVIYWYATPWLISRDTENLFSCSAGTTGSNSCARNPCLNSGTCQTVPGGGYVCICRPGFAGAFCDLPAGKTLANESIDRLDRSLSQGTAASRACATNPCVNGGSCETVNVNTFRCVCQAGFTGSRCDSTTGTIITIDHYSSAYRSFQGTATSNACNANPCGIGGSCQAVPGGGFRCICRPGYFGDLCSVNQSFSI